MRERRKYGVDKPWGKVEFQNIIGSKAFLQDIRRK